MENKSILEELNIKLKKTTLSNAEVDGIIKTCIEEADKPKDFSNFRFSPLSMRTTFYNCLFLICIEDYDVEDYEDLYSNGIHNYIINNINNASDCLDILMDCYKDIRDVSRVLDINIQEIKNLLESKMPDKKVLGKWFNKLPEVKELVDKTVEEHNKIIKNDNKKEDV